MANAAIRQTEREAKDIAIPSKDELRAMLADEVAPLWFRADLAASIYTGARASELRGLGWQYVDLDQGVIRIRERANFVGEIGDPKSKAGNRTSPLAPSVRSLLRELHLARGRPAAGLVFPTASGRPIGHGYIRRRCWVPLRLGLTLPKIDKSGAPALEPELDDDREPVIDPRTGEPVLVPVPLGRYGLHVFRHAAASLFIEQGWTAKKVQSVMGHSSIAVTYDIYGKLFHDSARGEAATAALEASLRA